MSRRIDRLNHNAIVIALAELRDEVAGIMQSRLPTIQDVEITPTITIVDEEIQYSVVISSETDTHIIPSQWQDIAESVADELASVGFRHPIDVTVSLPLVVAQEMPAMPPSTFIEPGEVEQPEMDGDEFESEEDDAYTEEEEAEEE